MSPTIARVAKLSLMLAMLTGIAWCRMNPVRQNGNREFATLTEATVSSEVRANATTDRESTASSSAEDSDRVFLPVSEGRFAVDVMELSTAPRFAELALRMKAAIQRDPEWFQMHVQTRSAPGMPLPYDSRFGISEAEYGELLNAGTQASYQKSGEAVLVVTATERGTYVLDGGRQMSDLTGIELDFANDRVVTQYGVLDARSDLDAPDTTALGAWKGVQWKKHSANQLAVLSTDFALGRLHDSGRGVLLYDVKKVQADGSRVRIDLVLTYELPSDHRALAKVDERPSIQQGRSSTKQ